MADTTRTKVAILGSGCGAMAAALALTGSPELRARYQVDIYQMGWRCGGKGAAGRNRALGHRIEEHGLHLWAGFYNNAFRIIRQVYAECASNPDITGVFKTWQDAFKPQNFMTLCIEVDKQWSTIDVDWPTNEEVPGTGSTLLSVWDYLHMMLDFVFHRHHHQSDVNELDAAAQIPDDERDVWRGVLDGHAHLGTAHPPRSLGAPATLDALYGSDPHAVVSMGRPAIAMRLAGHALHPDTPQATRATLFGHIARLCGGWLEKLEAHAKDALARLAAEHPEAWAWMQVVALVIAIVRGMIHDDVPTRGFDVLDRYDLTEYLKLSGAPAWALASPNLRGGYDYVFGYVGGDYAKPSFATGVALRGALRVFFTYKGAFLWTMQAGMGDTVFTPIYKVLKSRGVGIHFFHKVTNLGVADGRIANIDYELQMDAPDYDPFIPVNELQCWPSTPIYERLPSGDKLKSSGANLESFWSDWKGTPGQLRTGEHYDEVVLGISCASFEHMASELDADPRWLAMRQSLLTTRTFGTQLWLAPNAKELGWTSQRTVAVAYAEPLSTWADLSFLREQEAWGADVPQSIAYFCGVLRDVDNPDPQRPNPAFPTAMNDHVRAITESSLDRDIGLFWPNAMSSVGRFDVGKLHGHGFDDQYYRANVDPTERYVLSVPGSIELRLAADEAPFHNLWLAGDWVKTNISAGCVEAAMSAGLLAARALVARRDPDLAKTIEIVDQSDFLG